MCETSYRQFLSLFLLQLNRLSSCVLLCRIFTSRDKTSDKTKLTMEIQSIYTASMYSKVRLSSTLLYVDPSVGLKQLCEHKHKMKMDDCDNLLKRLMRREGKKWDQESLLLLTPFIQLSSSCKRSDELFLLQALRRF